MSTEEKNKPIYSPRIISMWEHSGWGNSIFFTNYDTRSVAGHMTSGGLKALNCQTTTKADARHNVELTNKTAIEPNACYAFVLF